MEFESTYRIILNQLQDFASKLGIDWRASKQDKQSQTNWDDDIPAKPVSAVTESTAPTASEPAASKPAVSEQPEPNSHGDDDTPTPG